MNPFAVVPLFLSGISTTSSIIQGVEARKQVRAGERAADDALASAKRKTEIDRFEALKAPIESYQFAEDIQTQREKQNLMALMESGPRALAAGVGKVATAGIQGTEQRRQQMAKDLFDLEKLQAAEAAKRDAALASLDLAAVEGAQLASLAAEQQAAAAFTGGFQTLAKAGMDIYKASDLYGKDIYAKELTRALDAGEVGVEDRSKYLDYIKGLGEDQFKNLSQEDLIKGFYDQTTSKPIAEYGTYYDPALFSTDFTVPTDQINASSFTGTADLA